MVSRIVSQFVRELIWQTGLVVYRHWFRLGVYGYKNLPKTGPYLLAANHGSHLDGPAVMAAQRVHYRHVSTLGATDYFFSSSALGWMSRNFLNMIPFDRAHLDFGAVRECQRVAAHGNRILMFPEGTRSVDGRLYPFKPGFGFIASRLALPIVPVYIHGASEALPKGRIWPRRRRVFVCFGEPIDPKGYHAASGTHREIYPRIAADVFRAIKRSRDELLGTAVDVHASTARDTPRVWLNKVPR